MKFKLKPCRFARARIGHDGHGRLTGDVAVKLEAFSFTRYGTLPGVIEAIASDARDDEKLGLIYPVRVRLLRSTIERDGRRKPIGPGMAAPADIKTGRRSIASYLVSPIDQARMSAGRER